MTNDHRPRRHRPQKREMTEEEIENAREHFAGTHVGERLPPPVEVAPAAPPNPVDHHPWDVPLGTAIQAATDVLALSWSGLGLSREAQQQVDFDAYQHRLVGLFTPTPPTPDGAAAAALPVELSDDEILDRLGQDEARGELVPDLGMRDDDTEEEDDEDFPTLPSQPDPFDDLRRDVAADAARHLATIAGMLQQPKKHGIVRTLAVAETYVNSMKGFFDELGELGEGESDDGEDEDEEGNGIMKALRAVRRQGRMGGRGGRGRGRNARRGVNFDDEEAIMMPRNGRGRGNLIHGTGYDREAARQIGEDFAEGRILKLTEGVERAQKIGDKRTEALLRDRLSKLVGDVPPVPPEVLGRALQDAQGLAAAGEPVPGMGGNMFTVPDPVAPMGQPFDMVLRNGQVLPVVLTEGGDIYADGAVALEG